MNLTNGAPSWSQLVHPSVNSADRANQLRVTNLEPLQEEEVVFGH